MNIALLNTPSIKNESSPIIEGDSISFPIDGSSIGTNITRSNATTFILGPIGVYHVQFQCVPTIRSSHFGVALNGYK